MSKVKDVQKEEEALLIASISAERLVIKDIFCDDYLFTIPNYQRPYSWEEEHCTQLLDDLHSFAFKEENFRELPPYFLGSAVIIKKAEETRAQIVDGQQRLTTLTILLSCLRYVIEDSKNKETLSKLIFQEGDELLGTSPTYRLRTRKRDQEFFKRLVQEEEGIPSLIQNPGEFFGENDAQEQMVSNVKALIEAFRLKRYDQTQLKLLTKYIIQKCIIVVVASTDEDMAFRIFNVLNDRGKDLTISDILKSEVLEKIPEAEQNEYTQKWEDVEVNLGIERFKDFFSHLRAIYAKRKAVSSVISEIRAYVNPAENPKDFIDKVLKPYTDAYKEVLEKNFQAAQFADSINQQLHRLNRVAHNDWVPSAILLLAIHKKNPSVLNDALIQLEKVTLGIEAMRASLNERIERFALINAIIEKKRDLYAVDSPMMLSEEDRLRIIETLTLSDLYGKRLVKPVLAKIEEQMNDGSATVHFHQLNIEHVLPQSPHDEYWTSRFGIEDRLAWTNNLGNLSLITVRKNTQAKNYPFPVKIETYFRADGRASNLAMVNELLDDDDWNVTRIEERNQRLLNHFLVAIGLNEVEQ